VISVGLVERTTAPVPVEVVTPVPPLATGSVPVTPVVSGRPVALVRTPEDGVPNAGVISVGLLAKTKAPEPVSSVTAEARFALVGVPKNVATPVPSPETPVDIGKPVAFVSVPLAGVPRTGAVNMGEVSVLLVSVSVPASVASVPEVGRVSAVVPETVSVVPKAPEIANVLAALFDTPVPPLFAGKTPVRLETMLDAILIKFDPFQAINAFSPAAIVTLVPARPLNEKL
jgi:hypothetical protein